MDKNTMYSAVNTKIASLMGKLLNENDYKNMMSLQSSQEIAQYLKSNTAYREYFKDRDTSTMHRDDIQRLLKETLIHDLDKLINYFNGDYRNFLKTFYLKYEIYDLKSVARLIHIDKDFENLKDSLIFAGKYRYIDKDKIVKARSISELIVSLEGTYYYPYLKVLVDGNTKENLFRFEMTLDKIYFIMLEENIKGLSKEDQEVFYKIYGSFIDLNNLQWIYRSKKYYGLSPEEIFNYAINKGYKFNYKKVKEFCYTRDWQELRERIKTTPYSFIFKDDESQDIFMERRINRYIYFSLIKVRKSFKNDISMFLSYITLLDFQIRDIISIIESVRYKMDIDETKKYLIKAI